jgi:hypothetical protein
MWSGACGSPELKSMGEPVIQVAKEVGGGQWSWQRVAKGATGTRCLTRWVLPRPSLALPCPAQDTENYLVERGAGVGKQFETLRREMQDVQTDLQVGGASWNESAVCDCCVRRVA